MVSVITSEELKRSGDSNAAGALAPVNGLSLVGGKFVYVRGLGERYSAAVLNGSASYRASSAAASSTSRRWRYPTSPSCR